MERDNSRVVVYRLGDNGPSDLGPLQNSYSFIIVIDDESVHPTYVWDVVEHLISQYHSIIVRYLQV